MRRFNHLRELDRCLTPPAYRRGHKKQRRADADHADHDRRQRRHRRHLILGLLDWLRGADSSLRAAATDTPVIVLTSQGGELHRVRVLERAGDDVLVKPFSYPELRARIAAVLRRTASRQPRPVLVAGPVRIDLRDRAVSVDERPVELSAVEYRLLCQLAGEPTRVLTKVNFETRPKEGKGSEGFTGSGRDW